MTDSHENLVAVFRSLRVFCNDVSKLLQVATARMADKGWCPTQPTAVFESSRAIDRPNVWLPYEFCRFYACPQVPELVCFVAVNIGYPKDAFPMINALLSAGCITFDSKQKCVETSHWMARWHLFMDDRTDNGMIFRDEPPKAWKAEEGWPPPAGIIKVETFAYPLVEIKDGETLAEKIIAPLMKLVKEQS